MVLNHDRLKRCIDRDNPFWLSRYQEKFKTPGETLSKTGGGGGGRPVENERVSSRPSPGSQSLSQSLRGRVVPSPNRRRRGRPRKIKDSSPEFSAKSSDHDPSSDSDIHYVCHKPDGRLMIQCVGWYHGFVWGSPLNCRACTSTSVLRALGQGAVRLDGILLQFD